MDDVALVTAVLAEGDDKDDDDGEENDAFSGFKISVNGSSNNVDTKALVHNKLS